MTSGGKSVKQLDEKHVELIGKLVSDIRSGKLQDTLQIALATLSFLEQIISETQNATAYELCSMLHGVGAHICAMLPHQVAAANMVRRVLRAVRDESRAHANQSTEVPGESLQRLVLAAPYRRSTVGPAEQDLREPLRDQIAELRAELESTEVSISSQARSHIDSGEVVLCTGGCALVESFLRAAAKLAPRVVVAEGQSATQSHALAARLSGAGVNVTVISNAAIFAVMPRVNKVVLGIKATLGGGATLAAPGACLVTSAAKLYNVPVLALAPLCALIPLHSALSGAEPQHSALYEAGTTHCYQHAESELSHVFHPVHDFITPEHITLFITNLGGSCPSYIYRILSELYDARDNNLVATTL